MSSINNIFFQEKQLFKMFRTNRQLCCIRSCENRNGTFLKNISFFRFPQQGTDLRKRWEEALNNVEYIMHESSLICSQHFDACDKFLEILNGTFQCVLRQDAVPNVIITENTDYGHIDDDTMQHVDANDIKMEPIELLPMAPDIQENNQNRSWEFAKNCTECTAYKKELSILSKKCDELMNENRLLRSQLNDPLAKHRSTFRGECQADITQKGLNQHMCISQRPISSFECETPSKLCEVPFKNHTHQPVHIETSLECVSKIGEIKHQQDWNIKSVVIKERKFQCLGGKIQKNEMKRHLKQHDPNDESQAIETPVNEKLVQTLGNKSGTIRAQLEKATKPKCRRDRRQKIIVPRKAEFECYICKYQPENYPKMEQHMEQHVAARDQRCDICHEMFTSNELKVHLCGAETDLKCEYCTRSFNVTSEILLHLENDHDNKILYKCVKCRRCARFFGTKYLRDLHERLQKVECEERPFVCSICFKSYKNKPCLDDHMISHTSEKKYLCSECGKSFTKNTLLKSHMVWHGPSIFQCSECPANFKSQKHLKLHATRHQNVQFKCCKCSAVFSSSTSLTKHEHRIHRNPAKNFACQLCSMKFTENNKLASHMRTHTGDKPFACEFCDRKYAYKGDMTKHLKIHVGDNIYKCDECGDGFRLQIELRHHMNEHYRQQKMYNQTIKQKSK